MEARVQIIILTACIILAVLGIYFLLPILHEPVSGFLSGKISTSCETLELQDAAEKLQRSVEDLKESYLMLESNYNTLSTNFSSVYEDYKKLQERVEQVSKRVLMKPEDLPEIINLAATSTSKLELLLYRIKISHQDRPEVKAEKILSWILMNLQYIPDDFHEIVIHESILQVQNHISLPEEIIDRGGGDCEDLAVLTYALLNEVTSNSESVYLIALEGVSPYSYRYRLGWAHIAVLYKIGDEFIIIDPAGAYITDRKYTMKIILERGSEEEGEYAIMSLDPLMLPPRFKDQLVKRGVANLTFMPGSSIKATTIEDALFKWIKEWEKRVPQIQVDFIANSTFYMRFNSTKEFLNFVNSGGLNDH
ncbi:MAG: transglutaminase-like domain-containing protein [Candidatus Parvarchaeota archaeon]